MLPATVEFLCITNQQIMELLITQKINASAAAAWELISDFENIHRFHPLLKTSGFIGGSCTHEPGATRQCEMLDGRILKEKITDWKENSHYSIEVYETSLPLKSSSATMGISVISADTSLAYMAIRLQAKYWILAPFLYVTFNYFAGPAILRKLRKLTEQTEKAKKSLRLLNRAA